MNAQTHFAIRGGVHGRERLRLIACILQPTTTASFDRLGVVGGLACLDVGRGGGDVTFEPAHRVGPHVDLHVVQPAASSGETTLVHALTRENIMDAVLADGLATRQECDGVLRELDACADDPQTVMSLPRIVQAWRRRGA